jgi:hypothetical protein
VPAPADKNTAASIPPNKTILDIRLPLLLVTPTAP